MRWVIHKTTRTKSKPAYAYSLPQEARMAWESPREGKQVSGCVAFETEWLNGCGAEERMGSIPGGPNAVPDPLARRGAAEAQLTLSTANLGGTLIQK